MKTGIQLIESERIRQVKEEKISLQRDAQLTGGELQLIAVAHINKAQMKQDVVKNLTIAGALIAAELDRLLGMAHAPHLVDCHPELLTDEQINNLKDQNPFKVGDTVEISDNQAYCDVRIGQIGTVECCSFGGYGISIKNMSWNDAHNNGKQSKAGEKILWFDRNSIKHHRGQ